MKEKVRQEVLKLLEAGMIYHISDNSWVSLVQVVPKKDDMIVVKNDKNETIPTTTVRGWRICVNYRRFNNAIRKDKFPFPFTDKMLERVFDRAFYSFLDGYSGYNQIAVANCRTLPFGGRATRDSRDACSTKGIRAESPPTFI